MRLLSFVPVGIAALLLAACGSGGGGIGSTPPPPVQTNSSLTNLQFSETFSGDGADTHFSVSRATGGGTPLTLNSGAGAMSYPAEISYNAQTRSYTIRNGDRTALEFVEADRVAARSNSSVTFYEKKAGGVTDNLVLFNSGAANPQLALSYTSYGAWQKISDQTSSLDVRSTFFTYGVQTAASDMPRTGTASYRTIIDGQFADAQGVYALGGTSSFSADFGSGTVQFGLSPSGQHILTGALRSFATFSGAGRIDSNRFSGSSTAGGYNANIGGRFYGPGAAEMGGIFTITTAGGVGSGAIVGKKN